MDILQAIREDHENVLELMEQIEKASSHAIKKKEQTFAKLKKEVMEHMHGEETTFYSFLLENCDDRDTIFEAFEEHRVVRLAMPDLESTSIDDEQWNAKFKVVSELIKHHIMEEQKDVFKEARKVLDKDTSSQLAQDFSNAKKESHART
jgi:hypothetical protein